MFEHLGMRFGDPQENLNAVLDFDVKVCQNGTIMFCMKLKSKL